MRTGSIISAMLFVLVYYACDIENPIPDPIENPEYANWTIPKDEIMIRDTANDIISSIDTPQFVPATSVGFLTADELVLGISIKGEYRAYPISILNYHEVINEELPTGKIMISYCPLSGSSMVWERDLQGISTTFGVSKYIYNSHHILYDRISYGHWLPLKYACVNGELEGYIMEGYHVVETIWGNWSSMFPGSRVLSPPTGTQFNYSIDKYEAYESSDSLYFPVKPLNQILPLKTRVHGIIVDNRMKVYKLGSFGDSTSIIQDNFQGLSIVVIGNQSKAYIVSYERRIPGGPELDFTPAADAPNIIMTDDEGNKYDIFGLVVSGPRKGQALKPTQSMMAYWFAVAAMYPDPIIY